jgi:hypothetical protein
LKRRLIGEGNGLLTRPDKTSNFGELRRRRKQVTSLASASSSPNSKNNAALKVLKPAALQQSN